MGVKFVLSKARWLEVGGGVFIPLPEKEPLQTEKSDIPI